MNIRIRFGILYLVFGFLAIQLAQASELETKLETLEKAYEVGLLTENEYMEKKTKLEAEMLPFCSNAKTDSRIRSSSSRPLGISRSIVNRRSLRLPAASSVSMTTVLTPGDRSTMCEKK